MSRSNPNAGNNPSPATCRFNWSGSKGIFTWYNKESKKNEPIGVDFGFLYLDETACIGGFNKQTNSGLWSNEVRDTRTEPMVVRNKGGVIASGFYAGIKDKVVNKAVGGKFVDRIYIAYKDSEDKLAIGTLELSGSAMSAWFEFRKANRAAILTKAIRVKSALEATNGGITFQVPQFTLADVKPETDVEAKELDKELQKWMVDYFASRKGATEAHSDAQPDGHGEAAQPDAQEDHAPDPEPTTPPPPEDDDIPF